jgi:hypothetical protein
LKFGKLLKITICQSTISQPKNENLKRGGIAQLGAHLLMVPRVSSLNFGTYFMYMLNLMRGLVKWFFKQVPHFFELTHGNKYP